MLTSAAAPPARLRSQERPQGKNEMPTYLGKAKVTRKLPPTPKADLGATTS